ncbi:MAG: aminopeptidase [Nanoarchaeota archaeon]
MPKYTEIILKKCLGLKKNESFLVVTDNKLLALGKEFLEAAKKITSKTRLIKILIPKVHGTEPSNEIAKEMLNYDAEILITTNSLSHTNARINACKKGARIVTMPGITKEILERTIDIDYNKLTKVHKKLGDIIDEGKKVKITTKLGTNLKFSIKGRKAFGRDSGLFTKKGSFGNLPTGEIFVAPVERTANGIYVVDASFAGIGKLKSPIKIYVKNGHAVKIEGKKADALTKLLDSSGKEARNIAEFGIGTNEKAKITGNILEDEKVIGTCHIALGNNVGFGGKTSVQLHLDGIIKNPTIFVDGNKILDKGKLLF